MTLPSDAFGSITEDLVPPSFRQHVLVREKEREKKEVLKTYSIPIIVSLV